MATSKSESSAKDTLFSLELDTFPCGEIENLKDGISDLVVIADQLVDRSSVTTEHDNSDCDDVNLNMNQGDSDTEREDNSSISHTVGHEVSSDEYEETTYTADDKMKPSASPQLIEIRPSKLTLKWSATGIVSVTNATHKRLVLYSVVDENNTLQLSPLAGVLFPQETAEISCRSLLEKGIGGSGALIFTATEINSDTDVTGYDERKCQRTLDGYVKVGNPAETVSLTYRIKPLKSQKPAPRRRHKSETSIGADNSKSWIRPHPSHSAVSQRHSSESTITSTNIGSEMAAEADDEMSNVKGHHSAPMRTSNGAAASAAEAAYGGKRVRINSKHISVYDQSITGGDDSDQTQSQTDDEKLEWMRLAVEEESKVGNSLERLHRRIRLEEKTLNEHIEEIEIMSTGTEALMHMLKALDGEAKEFELILFPRDNHLIMELKSEIQSYMVTYQGNLERMLRQQGTLYQLLDRHQSDLQHPGLTSVLQPGSHDRAHTRVRYGGHRSSGKNTGEQLPQSSEQSSTGYNISSNALMAKSGRARGNHNTAENDPASLNMTSNAGQKEKHYTHTIKGRGTAHNLDDVATNQSHMEKEMTVMRTDLHNVDTHTEALLNMMTDLTSKVRSNRDGILAGVNGLQEKMKKAGFSLAEIEGEGDRNKATIALLQTNFNAHLDKIMSILSDTKQEQGKMKKQANQLNTGFRKAKTNILRISDGVYEEHKHITQLNLETNNKIDNLSAKQHLAERILKDMHKDMRIAMCKLKHLVCQINRLILMYTDFKRALLKDFSKAGGEPGDMLAQGRSTKEIKFNQMRSKVTDLTAVLRELQARNEHTANKTGEQAKGIDLHLTLFEQQMARLENLIRELLSKAKDEIGELDSYIEEKIAEFFEKSDDLQDRMDEYHRTVDAFKDELTGAGTGINKALLEMIKSLKDAASEKMAKVTNTIAKMDASLKQLLEDLQFLLDLSGGVDGRIANVAADLAIKIPEARRALEDFIRETEIQMASQETRVQNHHKEIMDEIKALIELINEFKVKEKDKGLILTKFAMKLKNDLDELLASIGNCAVQLGIHEHTLRNKMHELLRQNAIDNHKALKDARQAMTGEINARIDQISREQFKEVQIYIDKIKERINKTTRGLQAAVTAADWAFYFLMMICILMAMFLYTAIAFTSEEVMSRPKGQPWVPRLVSKAAGFVWNWDD